MHVTNEACTLFVGGSSEGGKRTGEGDDDGAEKD
jgi:hypothetical protein